VRLQDLASEGRSDAAPLAEMLVASYLHERAFSDQQLAAASVRDEQRVARLAQHLFDELRVEDDYAARTGERAEHDHVSVPPARGVEKPGGRAAEGQRLNALGQPWARREALGWRLQCEFEIAHAAGKSLSAEFQKSLCRSRIS
jgi:hypothetical protein